MIALSEALSRWLGRLEDDHAVDDHRALFSGAGFTKATWSGAPLFSDLEANFRAALADTPIGQTVNEKDASIDSSDLVEAVDHYRGRRHLARCLLAEPVGVSRLRLTNPAAPFDRPPPSRMAVTFRTIEDWIEGLRRHGEASLSFLTPSSPPLLVARFVKDRVVRDILSTNWDSFLELGCHLGGVRIVEGEQRTCPADRDRRPSLEVFESAKDISARPRSRDHAKLYKLHGGVRTMTRLMTATNGTDEQSEEELRNAFLASSSDLLDWSDRSQWVADIVGVTLRSSRVMTIGVGGADVVVYRAFRKHMTESGSAQRLPTTVAVDRSPSVRLTNMMHSSSREPSAVATSDGAAALRHAYAWWFLGRLQHGLTKRGPSPDRTRAARLNARIVEEVDNPTSSKGGIAPNLTDVIVDAIGPALEWIQAARHPESIVRSNFRTPTSIWDYCSWPTRWNAEFCRQVVAMCDVLTTRSATPSERLEVDPWTGIIHLPRRHLVADIFTPGRALGLLPIPDPWHGEKDADPVSSARLAATLTRFFRTPPSRHGIALARAPLRIVRLGGMPTTKIRPSTPFRTAGVETDFLADEKFEIPDWTKIATRLRD